MSGIGDRLRSVLAGGLAILQTRLELLATEVAEEKVRLAHLLGYAAAAFFFLGFGAVLLALFLTVLLWESHRLLALGVFAAFFLAFGLIAALAAARIVRKGSRLFAASIAELAQDRQMLLPDDEQQPR